MMQEQIIINLTGHDYPVVSTCLVFHVENEHGLNEDIVIRTMKRAKYPEDLPPIMDDVLEYLRVATEAENPSVKFVRMWDGGINERKDSK